MARIRLVAPVSDIRGELGNAVYSNWKGLPYTRNLATSIANPQSENQIIVRNAFSQYSERWLVTLTADQRKAWEEYAQQQGAAQQSQSMKGYKSLMPDLGMTVTGKNAYIALNVLLARVGLAAVSNAPLGLVCAPPPDNMALTYNGPAPGNFVITWTDPSMLGANDLILVWAEWVGTAHKQLISWALRGVQTKTITGLRGKNGNLLPLGIGLYRFQLVTLTEKGMRSAGSRLMEHYAAT